MSTQNHVHLELENQLVILSIPTIRTLFSYKKQGLDSLTLYLFYYFTAKCQKTDTPRIGSQFCMNGLDWGWEKYNKANSLLKKLNLIETSSERDKDGKIISWHVKIKYLWEQNNKEEIFKTPKVYESIKNPSATSGSKPTCGKTTPKKTTQQLNLEGAKPTSEVAKSTKISSITNSSIEYSKATSGKNPHVGKQHHNNNILYNNIYTGDIKKNQILEIGHDINNRNINRNIKNNTVLRTAETSSANNESNQINELIDLFKDVNPSYKQLFSNKTQRAALQRLIKEHTAEKMIQIINCLKDIVFQPYAPKITKPTELENNFGKLVIFVKQNEQMQKGGMAII